MDGLLKKNVSVRMTNIGTFLSVCKKNKTWVIRLQGLFRQIGNSFSYIQFVKIITSTDNKKWQNCLLMWMRLVPLKRLV